jgi:inosine/xanthosine triphosphate pyrophosphatase family protein
MTHSEECLSSTLSSGQIGGPCITEDTALAFHAMKGLPGPYIKDFMKTLGHDGELDGNEHIQMRSLYF